MATQQDPWAEFRTGPATQAPARPAPAPVQPRAPGIIQGQPRQAPPVTPVQDASMRNDAERLRIAQAEEARRQALFEQEQAAQDDPAAQTDDAAALRAARLRALVEQSNRVEKLFQQNIEGGLPNPIAGRVPFVPSNEQFNSAGAGLAEQGLAAFRVPGVGAQSDAELRAFVDANRPMASDTDAAIQEKLRNLRSRAAAELEALGGTAVSPQTSAGTQTVPGGGRDVSQLQSALERGASRDEILAIANQLGLSVDEAALDANLRSRDQGGAISGFIGPDGGGGGGAPQPTREGLAATLFGDGTRSIGQQLGAGVGDIVQGAGDLIGIAVNPIGQMMNDALGIDQRYDAGQIMRGATGLPDNPNELQSAITRGATSALIPAAGAARASSLVTNPTARGALSTVGQSPIRDAAAGAGAGAGAYAARDYGPVAQVGAALLGGMGAYGAASGATRAFTPRGVAPAGSLADDATELGIDMLPADAGGTATRMATGAARVTLGELPIAAAAERSLESARNARSNVAGRIGEAAADPEGAGQTVRRGLSRWLTETGDGEAGRTRELFEAVPIPKDAPVQPVTIRQSLAELTQGFQSNRELSDIWVNNPRLRATLEALTPEDVGSVGARDLSRNTARYADAVDEVARLREANVSASLLRPALREREEARVAMLQAQRQAKREPVGGELSWGDASRLRSIVGEIIDQPGLAAEGNATAQLRKFYGAITADMERAAAEQGPRALTLWRRAVQYKRGRESRVDEVITSILGNDNKRNDGAVFEQINRWSQQRGGDFRSLARTLRSMDPEEVNTVRATLLDRMGDASKGRQNAEGDVFSPATFVTEWNGLSDRAKAMLFPAGEHRDAVRRLVRVMDAMQNAGAYANTSKTALAGNVSAAAVLVGFDQAVLAGMGSLGSLAVGRILASKRLAMLLARAPRNASPRGQEAYLDRLLEAARPEPALVPIVTALRENILRGANDNFALPANVAAGSEDDQN